MSGVKPDLRAIRPDQTESNLFREDQGTGVFDHRWTEIEVGGEHRAAEGAEEAERGAGAGGVGDRSSEIEGREDDAGGGERGGMCGDRVAWKGQKGR